jgi:hypothetical protein
MDWQPRRFTDERSVAYRRQIAPLENGHELHIWENLMGGGWGWAVYVPANEQEAHPDNWPASSDYGRPGCNGIKMPKTEEEAKAAAEGAYRILFPIGTHTGEHDSGIDYSDLNSFMRAL